MNSTHQANRPQAAFSLCPPPSTASSKLHRLAPTYVLQGAVLSIQAGAGGTDAQDWAEMLERMYLRWAERQGYTCRVVDRAPGEE